MTGIAYEFDLATTARATNTPGCFDVEIDEGFTVGPKPNGGYLVALVVRAMGLALEQQGSAHRDALVATTHFVSAPDPGPATVNVEVLRVGRSASQVRATIEQNNKRCVDVVATMGELPQSSDPTWSARTVFDVAPIEECYKMVSEPPGAQFKVSIMDRNDLRLDTSTLAWAMGKATGRGELKGWISFADGRPIDSLALLFFLDALIPATFDIGRSGWVPTLSLTTYLRLAPAPGPLRVRQAALSVGDGRVDEVCELWDSAGHLVGHATQLAAIRFNDESSLAPFPR